MNRRGFCSRRAPAAIEDLTGQRFGLVTVTGPAPSLGHGARWKCRCDCGADRVFVSAHLRQRPPATHRNCGPVRG